MESKPKSTMKLKGLLAALMGCAIATSAAAGNFTVGVEAHDYMPISKGDGGAYSGYARELLDAFAAKYGHSFTYKPLPIARLYDEYIVQKSFDLKFPDNALWANDAKKGVTIVYSNGLVSVTEGLMVQPANKGKGVESIAKMATLRGFTPWPYMDQIKAKKIAVSEVATPDAAINMVASGRVDGLYLGTLAATYIVNEVMKKPGIVVFDDKLPNAKNDFTLSSISHPEVVKQMNEFLAKEKDTVVKLKAKYRIVE